MSPTETELIDITIAPTPSLVERLAQLLGSTVSAQTVYGEPVQRAGVTVIPVARAAYGFGGGNGTSPKSGPGSGGGGGATITPVGYIEMRDGSTRFRRISGSVVPLVAVSGLVAWLLLRNVPRVLGRRPRIGEARRPAERVVF